MEDGDLELKRGKRRRLTQNAINKQKRIAKQSAWNSDKLLEQPHRFAKHHALDCGNPRCLVCHPEKVFRKPTIQEKKINEAWNRNGLDDS